MLQDHNSFGITSANASSEEVALQSRKVSVDLKAAVVKGKFNPGEPLRETALGDQFHVARSAVRQALQKLESEGLVKYIPNRGFFAATITLADAEDVYQTREVLEGQASKLFTERATPNQIGQLQEAVEEFAEAAKTPEQKEALLSTKNHFYDVLLEGCGNKVIQDLLVSLRDRISWLRAQTLSQPGRPDYTLKELGAIVEAIQSEDPVKAEEASKKHVRQAAKVAYNVLRTS